MALPSSRRRLPVVEALGVLVAERGEPIDESHPQEARRETECDHRAPPATMVKRVTLRRRKNPRQETFW